MEKIRADNRHEFAFPDSRGIKIKGMEMILNKVR